MLRISKSALSRTDVKISKVLEIRTSKFSETKFDKHL